MLQTAKPIEETITEFVERTTQLRAQRKEHPADQEGKQELCTVLDEAALRKIVGSPEIMPAQYAEIVRLAAHENVTVQILPMAMATYRSSFNVTLLEFDSPLPTVILTDSSDGSNVSDDEGTAWAFHRKFDALRAGALAPSETLQFLHRLAEET